MITARRQVRWCVGALAVLALLAFGGVIAGDYVFDDVHSVSGNPAFVEPDFVWRALTDPSAFSGKGQRMYRPALLLAFGANFAISPAAWCLKAGNVLLHAAVAALLFGWLRALRLRTAAAFVAAAMFAVHPLASETVNLVSARSEQLLALGALLALRSHLAWHRGRRPWLAQVGMVAGVAIACGSKETGVVLPVVMCAQAVWLRRAGEGRPLRRIAAGVLLPTLFVVGYLVVRKLLLGQATAAVFARAAGDPTTGAGRTLEVHLATMGTLLPRGLLQTVAPFGLTLDPPVTFRTFADPWALLGWAALGLVSVAAAWPGRRAASRRIGLVLAWTLALPWIVVPLNVPLAEHRLYGPMLGVAAIGAALLPRIRFGWRGRQARWAVGCAAVLLSGIGLSWTRTADYRDEVSLWRAELARNPESFPAWWGLGAAHLRNGRAALAIEPLATAVVLRPQHVEALSHYVEALVELPEGSRQPVRALAAAIGLAERMPKDPWIRTLLCRAHLQMGAATGDRAEFATAERVALSCLEIAPPKSFVYLLAAEARQRAGDLDGALALLDTSVQRGLDHVAVRLARATLLRGLGRGVEARRELARAQQMAPMDPAVLSALREAASPPR